MMRRRQGPGALYRTSSVPFEAMVADDGQQLAQEAPAPLPDVAKISTALEEAIVHIEDMEATTPLSPHDPRAKERVALHRTVSKIKFQLANLPYAPAVQPTEMARGSTAAINLPRPLAIDAEQAPGEEPGPPRLDEEFLTAPPSETIQPPPNMGALLELRHDVEEWFANDPTHTFTSRQIKEEMVATLAAVSSAALIKPSHDTSTFTDNEFQLTTDFEHMNEKARAAVIAMASTQRFVGPNTQSLEPIAAVIISKMNKRVTEKFAHGFADGELHGLVAGVLQQPIYLVDKYIADVKKAALEVSGIFDTWHNDEIAFLDNGELIKQYCRIIAHPDPADSKAEIRKLPKEIKQEYYNIPVKDNLTVVQWVVKKLAAELTVLDYTNPVLYEYITKTLDALLAANHQLTILQRSGIHHRDNIKIFSYGGQKSIESEEGLEVLHNRLLHLEDKVQTFIDSTHRAFQQILTPLRHRCNLTARRSNNPHLQTYEHAEILCQYIINYYNDYYHHPYFTRSHPKHREELGRLFSLVKNFQNSKLKKEYKQSVDYYLEQKRQFDSITPKTSPSASTTSSPTTATSPQVSVSNLFQEQKERAAQLREYQETVLNPYAETLTNLGPLPDDQVKRILKAAFLRLYLQLSKALKEDDAKAKYTVQAAILELRVYKKWFDAQKNKDKEKLLEETQAFFGKAAQDSLDGKPANAATKAKIGLALAFAACAGACFAVSGDFSLDNPDFEMPNEFDHFAAYYGSFGSNFLLYFNSFQIIFETYLDNMKELWKRMNQNGFFISSDYRVVPVSHWQKKGDLSQIIGYAVGSTILVCFGLSELLGWYTILISPFVFLSILLVSRFAIDSRCDNLNQKLVDKVFGKEHGLGWKIWWGFLFAGVGSISSAMGYATLGKFVSAFSELIPISLIGADPLTFVSTALFSIGYAVLFASKIPAWIRIPLGVLCICASLAILGYLAVTLGPGIFLLAAASFVAVTTTMMVFKMLSNAFIKFRENITELWKLFKHTREENPNIGAGLLVGAFVLCTLAVALNAVVFGALSILGLQDTLPMFTPDTPSAFLQPLWYLVTGFSALNGFNTSIGVQRRFVAHFGDFMAMFCEKTFPEYNKMLAREYAKNKGSQTSLAAWILGAPLFLAAAAILFTVGTLVYLTCAATQKMRGQEVSAVVTPWQALKTLVNAYAQDNGWRTTAAVWCVGAPLFIVAATVIHVTGWFVYAACIKVQQLRHKDTSSLVTPTQFLDMTMKFFMRPLLRFLNSLGNYAKSNEIKMKEVKTPTSGRSTPSTASSTPVTESSRSSTSSPAPSTGCLPSFRNMFKREGSAPDPITQPLLAAPGSA